MFDHPSLEYIKGVVKNKNYEKPAWLNQKTLSDRLHSFMDVVHYCKAITTEDFVFDKSPAPRKSTKRSNTIRPISPAKETKAQDDKKLVINAFRKVIADKT